MGRNEDGRRGLELDLRGCFLGHHACLPSRREARSGQGAAALGKAAKTGSPSSGPSGVSPRTDRNKGAMRRSRRDQDKLLILMAVEAARRRHERGLRLNHPEAMALISAELMESAREGRWLSCC